MKRRDLLSRGCLGLVLSVSGCVNSIRQTGGGDGEPVIRGDEPTLSPGEESSLSITTENIISLSIPPSTDQEQVRVDNHSLAFHHRQIRSMTSIRPAITGPLRYLLPPPSLLLSMTAENPEYTGIQYRCMEQIMLIWENRSKRSSRSPFTIIDLRRFYENSLRVPKQRLVSG